MKKRVIFAFIIVLAFFSLGREGEIQVSAQTPKQEYDGWIVSYDSAINPNSLGLESFGSVKQYNKGRNFPYSFAVVRGQAGKRPVSELSRVSGVRRIEPNYLVHLDTTPNDPLYTGGQQWYLGPTATNMALAWPTATTETIGIIDTGCATSHPDLPIIPPQDRFETLDGIIVNGGANDVYGHGSWVLGIIGMLPNNSIGGVGILWNLGRVVCIKAFHDEGWAGLADLALAIQLAHDQDIRFLNASWGTSDSQFFQNSVSYFLATGNSYIIASCGNNTIQPCNYPANYSTSMEGVVAVGALKKDLTLADFASYGPTLTFVEPGVDICSTIPPNTYACHDGTSGSVPIALGIATAAHNIFPLPRTAFLQFLKSKAIDLGTPGFDNSFGWGMLTSGALENRKYYFPIVIRK